MSDDADELEPIISQLTITALKARIAELEAERDRLKFALEIIRAGETLDPRRAADAALSPSAEETT